MADRLLRKSIRERFLVTLVSGEAFDGLLDEWDRHHLVFVDAGTVPSGQTARASIAGQLWLAREKVAYSQRLPR